LKWRSLGRSGIGSSQAARPIYGDLSGLPVASGKTVETYRRPTTVGFHYPAADRQKSAAMANIQTPVFQALCSASVKCKKCALCSGSAPA
jgi:hypothetical protein